MEIQATSQSQLHMIGSFMTRFDIVEERFEERESNASAALPSASNTALTCGENLERFGRRESDVRLSSMRGHSCSRYCKCGCHRTTFARTPGWMRVLMGSLAVQQSGAISLRARSCDNPACRSERGKALRESLFIFRYRGSPIRLDCSMPSIEGDLEYFKTKISERQLMPTDVTAYGTGLLTVSQASSVPRR
ncbi:hypothetical protein QBC35DRAFT_475989 [Podospora australis]|uniref:Uncharacterized protein n=1 Tax=Podospora australis TaxID=1536484 RepID=A0AAN6WT71_9PEZI|nr:hypothetical protein QBC35DRAFT_475989 [Podospora australis]